MAMTRVVWLSEDTHWDEDFIRRWTSRPGFEHSVGTSRADDGAVVVIPGQHHVADALTLADQLAALPWSLAIITSDEEALFPIDALPQDSAHETWCQYHARAGAERVIPIGCPPGTAETLAKVGAAPHTSDLFFAGQDTHSRRHELLAVMKDMAADHTMGGTIYRWPSVAWIATTGFRQGLTQEQYLAALSNARLAPCPSGPHSLDSFRLYEALAAGALPIIEAQTPHGFEGEFWVQMFGDDCPIPILVTWKGLPILAEHYADGTVWREKRDEVQAWWADYQALLEREFDETIERLR